MNKIATLTDSHAPAYYCFSSDGECWARTTTTPGRRIFSFCRKKQEDTPYLTVDTGFQSCFILGFVGNTRHFACCEFVGRRDVVGRAPAPICVKIWDSETGRLVNEFHLPAGFARRAVLSPNGRLLGLAVADQYWLVDFPGGSNLRIYPGTDENHTISFHADGHAVAFSGNNADQEVEILIIGADEPSAEFPDERDDMAWDRFSEKWCLKTWFTEYDAGSGAIFSPSGAHLGMSHWNPLVYSYPDRKIVHVFDTCGSRVEEPRSEFRVKLDQLWSKPTFSPDGRLFICCSPAGTLFVWDVLSGKLRDQQYVGDDAVPFEVTPTGNVVTYGRDQVELWELA